jgi:hypothetical protein
MGIVRGAPCSNMIDEIRELTEEDFARAIPRKQR